MGLNGKGVFHGNRHTNSSEPQKEGSLEHPEHAKLDRSNGFVSFATQYKVGERYAHKALAIGNH